MADNSKVIFTEKENKNISKTIEAMVSVLDTPVTEIKPAGLFHRRVIVTCERVKLDSDDIDIEFEVPFDDDTEANEATITIYNLSNTTKNHLKYNSIISITAGYEGDTGVIFSGRISKKTTKHDGVDIITTINAIDSTNLKERNIKSLSYTKGVKASYILKDLVKRLNLPIAVFKPATDYVHTDDVTIDGGIMENIESYATMCGSSAYVLKGKVYVQDIRKSTGSKFNINADTGLVGSPEEFEEDVTSNGNYSETLKGYNIDMLLQHRMQTASKITLKSVDANGSFTVKSGTHSYNGDEFKTSIKVIS